MDNIRKLNCYQHEGTSVMPFQIVRNDITKMKVDSIVNAANPALQMGGGVCGAIFSAAGSDQLQAECDRIGGCETGAAVMTSGYNLPANYIIHTVGPIWHGGNNDEPRLLHNCYINSLALALQHDCRSIAFPLISSGIYGYPKDQALKVATAAITEFLLEHDITVYLVAFDKKALVVSGKLFTDIEEYIDDNYVEEKDILYSSRRTLDVADFAEANYAVGAPKRSLEQIIDELEETFPQMLLRLIDEKGFTDVQTYKRANVDRKLFSKIRNSKKYNPSKVTAIAFAIALELNLDQTLDLLRKAGYTLSHSNKFDVIIEYFIIEGKYDIHEINEVLFYYDQPLLGI